MTALRWTAARDGIAHAHPSARATACGSPVVAERFAWPTRARCTACTAALADASTAVRRVLGKPW